MMITRPFPYEHSCFEIQSLNNEKSPYLKVQKDSRKERERKFKCDQCGFAATHKYKLSLHKKTHNTSKDFKCEQCDYKTQTLANLRTDFINSHIILVIWAI